ncbi:GNAT family N-acetyltransferase [Nocardiopsis alkaliphila]|uniref:GNAT family N-acetyltransferase n=1 Tax=Nocardiopsis alkaliphila TaxID=225762 RepID=UPI00034A7B94|nr:GNAT family N-acetyltransferase [Nocardiopsis alkaliphila]
MGRARERRDGVAIRAAGRRDMAAVSGVLARAFVEDPFVAWMFPQGRARRARRLYAIEAGFEYLPYGRVDVAVLEGRVVGAALWGRPGLSTGPGALRSLPHLVELFGIDRLPVVFQGLARLAEHTPRTPHWYLAELGTDPDVRGVGAGSGLLRHGLEWADAHGTPVFLESSSATNLPFYERFGFRVLAEVPMPHGPVLHTMLREPGAS